MQSYQELKVWQQAMDLATECYWITKRFPREELYGMVSQIRRSSASVPANISEGYGRKTRKEYIHFLYVARGSLKELETHIILSGRVQLASEEVVTSVKNQCESVGKLLDALIRSLESKA